MRSAFSPCIVIPCFNHHERLGPILKALDEAGLPAVVIDDGSSDLTRRALLRLEAAYLKLCVIRHAENKGKGAAVKTGLWWANQSGFTHAIQLDADGQHSLQDLPRFIAESESHPNALIAGYPVFDSTAPRARRWGRLLSVVLVWFETRSLALRDPLCGFRIYPIAQTLQLLARRQLGDRMDFDPEIAVRLMWGGVRVRSLKTQVIYPAGNASNFSYLRENAEMIRLHTRLVITSLVPFMRGRKSLRHGDK